MIADDAALLRQHADVLFEMDPLARLVTLNEQEPQPAPNLFLARGREARLVWFRAVVRTTTIERCERAVEELPAWDGRQPDPSAYDALRSALTGAVEITDESGGPAYRFGNRSRARHAGTVIIRDRTADLLERHFPYTRSVLASRSPVVAVIREGVVVAACYCARRRTTACEAGVATAEQFQGRGFAVAVVSAWRDAVEAAGMTPLYSTSWDNVASRRVAEKLGLIAYAETVSFA